MERQDLVQSLNRRPQVDGTVLTSLLDFGNVVSTSPGIKSSVPVTSTVNTSRNQHLSLIHRPLRGGLTSRYNDDDSAECLNPAKDAFEKAVDIFTASLSPAECDILWLRSKNTMQDVQNALQEARTRYEAQSPKGKIWKLLATCSSRVAYYAPVFDSLAQHYPEYVSLAWGAFKFFFTAMINYEELLAETSKAITDIANVLPRTTSLSDLYRTPDMQDAVAGVYAKIIEFVIATVEWYKQNKVRHVISAIVSPYKLKMKNTVDEIAERSRHVDRLADTAAKAELRDVHLTVRGLYQENNSLREEIQSMRGDFHKMLGQFHQISQHMIESQALHNQMLIQQQGQNSLLLEWQSEHIKHELKSTASDCGSASDMLDFCRSVRNRRKMRTPTHLPGPEFPRLKAWAEDQHSSLLLAQAQAFRHSSLDFAIDFVDAVLESRVPVIWAIPSSFASQPTITDILRALVLQTFSHSCPVNQFTREPIRLEDIQSARSVFSWFAILGRSLERFERVFVVIDMSLVMKAAELDTENGTNYGLRQFSDCLGTLVGSRTRGWLKIVLASYSSMGGNVSTHATDHASATIQTDRGASQERRFWNPRLRGQARRQMRMSSEKFRAAMGLHRNAPIH